MSSALFSGFPPERSAVTALESGDVLTYGQLNRDSIRLSRYLRSMGLETGKNIAILMENRKEYLVVAWAAMRAGLFLTPVSTSLRKNEVAYILEDCGADALVTSTRFADLALEVTKDLGEIAVQLIAGGSRAGFRSLREELLKITDDTPLGDESWGQVMFYSSGTTGQPKGIKATVSGGSIAQPNVRLQRLQSLGGMDEETRYLSPAPLYHAAPLLWNLAVTAAGGSCVIMQRFDAEGALQAIERFGITLSQWVPTMFVKMLKLPDEVRYRYDLSSMKSAIHAAAPCPQSVKRQMIEWWGPVINEYYSGSEGAGLTFVRSQEWLDHEGTVGRPAYGELHILSDAGDELPVGEIGNIYFESLIPFEYHNAPEKTSASRSRQGWVTMGDVGYIDEEGYLYLTDRKSFMIISGGVNIYPQEVENVLQLHPGVADVAVIGIPHEELGQGVVAVVEPEAGFEMSESVAEEMINFCRENISKIKCPRAVAFIDSMPRTETGKMMKRYLLDSDLTFFPAG